MQKLLIIVLMTTTVTSASECAAQPQTVLVFSRTQAFRHESIAAGIEAVSQIGKSAGFEVVATEDPSVFTGDNLEKYDAVIFMNTSGDILDEYQQRVMMEYIRVGGGFVGVHAASDTEHEWPWYGRLVGGYFNGHPDDPNVRKGKILVARDDHPATKGLPAVWIHNDEWYEIREFNDAVTVLLNVDEASYKRPEESPVEKPRPIAWYHEFDGGRAFYTALGHTIESYSDPLFIDHLRGGIEFALRR